MKFWDIQNAADAGGKASLRVYGNMGRWNDVDERFFVEALDSITAKELDVYIGSHGGSVQTGLVMYHALRRYAAKGTLRTHADGIVASAATLPFLAGDERVAPVGTLVMVHQALTLWAEGNADDLREHADMLEKVTESIADVYAARTGQTKENALALMKATTWMTAAEAVEQGFATVAPDAGAAQASIQGDVLNMGGRSYKLGELPHLSAASLAYVLNAGDRLPKAAPAQPSNVQPAAAGGKKEGEGPMDLEKLKAEHKDVHAAAVNEGKSEGVQAERARILAIQDATPVGFEADAQDAIKNGTSAADFALALLKKQREAGATFLKQRDAEANAEGGANNAPSADGKDKQQMEQEKLQAVIAAAADGYKASAGVKV